MDLCGEFNNVLSTDIYVINRPKLPIEWCIMFFRDKHWPQQRQQKFMSRAMAGSQEGETSCLRFLVYLGIQPMALISSYESPAPPTHVIHSHIPQDECRLLDCLSQGHLYLKFSSLLPSINTLKSSEK